MYATDIYKYELSLSIFKTYNKSNIFLASYLLSIYLNRFYCSYTYKYNNEIIFLYLNCNLFLVPYYFDISTYIISCH